MSTRTKRYARALVTGASSGIGEALAKRLARDGTEVVLAARRGAELARVAADIASAGGEASCVTLDAADPDAVAVAVRRIDDEAPLDLVIANAGLGGIRKADAITWEAIAPMLRVNFDGAIATLTALLPRMLERRRGHVVGVASISAYAPLPGNAVYGATKAGLAMFVEALRIDLVGSGVSATVVNPGFVDTPMIAAAKHPKPFQWTAERAADHIARRLPSAPAVVHFPLPLVAALRFARWLPPSVIDFVVKHGGLG